MTPFFERIRAAHALANAIVANRKPTRADLRAAGLPETIADRFPRK